MGNYKHYFIIAFDHHNRIYGVDTINPKDSQVREIFKEMKNSAVPFTHRVWFSSEKDIVKVLKEQSCEYQNITILKSFDDLMSFMK